MSLTFRSQYQPSSQHLLHWRLRSAAWQLRRCVGFGTYVRVVVVFLARPTLLDVSQTVSDPLLSSEHCVLCEAAWVLLRPMPCCSHQSGPIPALLRLSVGSHARAPSSRRERNHSAPSLPAHARTGMKSRMQTPGRAAFSYMFHYRMHCYQLCE